MKTLNEQISEIRVRQRKITKLIEELNDRTEKPWPQEGDICWCEAIDGEVYQTRYLGDDADIHCIFRGAYHKTEADAMVQRDRDNLKCKILQMLKEKNGDWIPDWGGEYQQKAFLEWCYVYNKITIRSCATSSFSKHVAKTKEIWRQIIAKFGATGVAEALEIK